MAQPLGEISICMAYLNLIKPKCVTVFLDSPGDNIFPENFPWLVLRYYVEGGIAVVVSLSKLK